MLAPVVAAAPCYLLISDHLRLRAALGQRVWSPQGGANPRQLNIAFLETSPATFSSLKQQTVLGEHRSRLEAGDTQLRALQ